MQSNKLENTLFILAILSLLLIVGLSFVTFPSSDDFSFYMDLSKRTILEQINYNYKNWDGRAYQPVSFVQNTFFKYSSAHTSIVIWSLCFILNAFFVLKIVLLELGVSVNSQKRFVVLLGITAVTLWIGFCGHISQTVYWATGGAYSMASSIALLWIFLFLMLLKLAKHKPKQLVVLFLLSINAGMLSQNLFPALFTFLGISYFLQSKGNRRNVLFVVALIGLLIGGTILFGAPGNYNRASLGANTLQLQPLMMLYHAAYVFAYYCYKSIFLVVFSLVYALILLPTESITCDQDSSLVVTKWKRLSNYKWLVVALSTILLFIFVPDFASARTALFFMFFVVLFIVSEIHWLAKNETFFNFFHQFKNENVKQKMMVIVFGIFILLISFHYYAATRINAELDERNKQFTNPANRGKSVCVPAIKSFIPFSFKFDDIKTDSTYWINGCVAKYYGLRSVRIDSCTK